MTEKTKLQQISDLAFDIQHTNDPQVAFDKAGEILRLAEFDQPPFKVGEYYSSDDGIVRKITKVGNDYTKVDYLRAGGIIPTVLYNLADYFDTWTPATAEQIATFKRAEQFAKHGRKLDEFRVGDKVKINRSDTLITVKAITSKWIHGKDSVYESDVSVVLGSCISLIQTAEELQEVADNE